MKIIKTKKQYKYQIFSDNARNKQGYYVLDFSTLFAYFNLSDTDRWYVFHYNKFEHTWGRVSLETNDYALFNESCLVFPEPIKALLLPQGQNPEILIRGVLVTTKPDPIPSDSEQGLF